MSSMQPEIAWVRVHQPGVGKWSARADVPLAEGVVVLVDEPALDPTGRPLRDEPEAAPEGYVPPGFEAEQPTPAAPAEQPGTSTASGSDASTTSQGTPKAGTSGKTQTKE